MYGYRFLSRGFTDPREILHGSSATSRTGLLLFWGDSRIVDINRGPYGGTCFLLKHLFYFFALPRFTPPPCAFCPILLTTLSVVLCPVVLVAIQFHRVAERCCASKHTYWWNWKWMDV